ncbi:hypothetical protein ACPESL_08135 [Psychrobacter pocilloporae]|uniref:hypothetical protein n=1 Tax=Psychrobacter pocilloporae TaxID=1775882 RepID=UPI003C2C81BF|tara:strand:- start:968 stop:1231 length:264 start_codon:yes stop_codon:yes gene_type:complete
MSRLDVGDLIVCVKSGGGNHGRSLAVGTTMRIDSFSSENEFIAYSQKTDGSYGGNGTPGLPWKFQIMNGRIVFDFKGAFDIFKKIEG